MIGNGDVNFILNILNRVDNVFENYYEVICPKERQRVISHFRVEPSKYIPDITDISMGLVEFFRAL